MNLATSILKAIEILKSYSPENVELGVTEIASKIGVAKSTAHRIMMTLVSGGLLQKNERTNKYHIGLELYILGSLYLNTTDLLKTAEPVIQALNKLTGEVTNMSIYEKGFVTLVMREESKHDFRWSRHVGSVVPAYASTMGKAFLAELTDSEINDLYPKEILVPLTPKTISSRTELKLDLESTRKRGFSIDIEGSAEGVVGIGAVVRDSAGKVIGAISIAAPVFRFGETQRLRISKLIKLGAGLISYQLGYQDPHIPVHSVQEINSWWEENKLDSSDNRA